MKALLLTSAVLVSLAGSLHAQTPNNDNCLPPSIGTTVGIKNFAPNSENATDSTLVDNAGCALRPTNLKDVFFSWRAPADGYYRISTASHMTIGYDTVMAVYENNCSGNVCLGYGDDISATNYGSEVFVGPMNSGDEILVQVGAWDNTVTPTSTNRLTFAMVDPPGDTCDTAIPIQAAEVVSFDTTNFNDGPDNGAICGGDLNDIYYEWIVPADGDYTLRSQTNYDGTFAILSDCDDAATGNCLFQSSGPFFFQELSLIGMTAGTVYYLKIGGVDSLIPSGQGTFEIWPTECDPLANDDAFEGSDDCLSPFPLFPGYVTDLFVATGDEDYYELCAPPGGTVEFTVNFTHADGDIDIELYNVADVNCGMGNPLVGSYSTLDSETVTWVNASSTEDRYIVRVFLCCGDGCSVYDLDNSNTDHCNTGSDVQDFCSPTANSTGQSTRLMAYTLPASPNYHLDADRGPVGEFGYFLVGTAVSEPGISVSDGFLCLAAQAGNSIGRFNVAGTSAHSLGAFDSQGRFENLVGTSSLPSDLGFDIPNTLPLSGSPTIQAGQTFHFQVWHRDTPAGSGVSNFSNGVSIKF